MNSQRVAGVCLFSLLVGGAMPNAPAFAAPTGQKQVKPETITCEEFLALGEEARPHVVYWIDGYAKSGKLKNETVEVDAFVRPITVVVDECKKAPQETLWQKIKNYF